MKNDKSSIQKKLAHFENTCSELGLKLTHQRMEIFRELASATDHPSAETLYSRLQQTLPTLSLDTVYRTLATFEKHNLVSRVQTVESHARFEAEMGHHHHVICSQCDAIADFDWRAFDRNELPEQITAWGKVEKVQVTMHGTCTKCLR